MPHAQSVTDQLTNENQSIRLLRQFIEQLSHNRYKSIFRFHFARLYDELKKLLIDPAIGKYWRIIKISDDKVDTEEIERINNKEREFSQTTTASYHMNDPDATTHLNDRPLNMKYENIHFLHKFHLFFYPQTGPYIGLPIPFHLVLCSKYPIHPPYIFTPLFHPAVYQTRMCLLREKWSISCTLLEVIYQIRIALEEPLFDEESFNQNVYTVYKRSMGKDQPISSGVEQKYPDQSSEFYQRVRHSLTHEYFW